MNSNEAMKKATALIDVVEKLCEDLTNAMHDKRWITMNTLVVKQPIIIQ